MGTNPSSFTKQPDEQFTITVDFSKQLDTDEVITAKVVSCTLDDVDKTSDIIAGSTTSGETVLVGVKGGVTAKDYKITTLITTDGTLPDSSNFKYESDIIMAVRAL